MNFKIFNIANFDKKIFEMIRGQKSMTTGLVNTLVASGYIKRALVLSTIDTQHVELSSLWVSVDTI